MDVDSIAKRLEDSTGEVLVEVLSGTVRKAEERTVEDDESDGFSNADILAPPYAPETLLRIFENSSVLGPNVAAMVTNVESFGHDFEPILDPEADSALEDMRFVLMLEAANRPSKKTDAVPEPEAVVERLEAHAAATRMEVFRAQAFFESSVVETSFVGLRRRTRMDLEVTGNAYWEVIRDRSGKVMQFVAAPTKTIRMTRTEQKLVEIEARIRVTPVTYKPVTRKRRFRRFVQTVTGPTNTTRAWFREFGDPRILSPKTGKFYADLDTMRAEERDETLETANEILHFKIPFPGTSYGVPRWIPALLAVLGTRQAEEVNFSYFDNKTVPPLALIVSGGRLAGDAKEAIKNFLENEIKGRQNFHKVLVIEGVPAMAGGVNPGIQADGLMKIELKPLTHVQQKDALFLEYDERNADKAGAQFRLPRLLRGDARDHNRATAITAVEMAETQVFGPERDEFDWMINAMIMPELGLSLVRFESRGVQIRDQAALAEIFERLAKTGGLVPADVRRLASMVLGVDLPDIDERWTTRPVAMAQSALVPNPLMSEDEYAEAKEADELEPEEPKPEPKPEEEGAEGTEAEDDGARDAARGKEPRAKAQKSRDAYKARLSDALVARKLIKLRDELVAREAAVARSEFAKGDAEPEVVLTVPAQDAQSFIEALIEAQGESA